MEIDVEEDRLLYAGYHRLRGLQYLEPRSDGPPQMVEREVFERGEASAILLYRRDAEKLVFVRQFRMPVHLWHEDGLMLEVAAGGMERGESPCDAAIRECREETGYAPSAAVHVVTMHPSPAAVKERLHLFFAEVSDGERPGSGGGVAEEHEDVETVELAVPAVREMLARGEFRDGKTIILLQWFFLAGPGAA
jgi:nudix-type nucleoside diphosphatase (YffH/AdpP family)